MDRAARNERFVLWAGGVLVLAMLVAGAFVGRDAHGDGGFVPARDDEVLESVPAGRSGIARGLYEAAAGRSAALRPGELLARAARFIAQGRSSGDPRFFGYAEAALARWDTDPDAPARARVLRAAVRSARHDFAGALADLDLALRRDPRDAQAWLSRATLNVLRADYASATAGCDRLAAIRAASAHTMCRALVDAVAGNARGAQAALMRFPARALRANQIDAEPVLSLDPLKSSRGATMFGSSSSTEGLPPAERVWTSTLLGEIAAMLGDGARALTHFRHALVEGARDPYLAAAYADLLLDLGRVDEASALLAAWPAPRPDAVELRLAIASARGSTHESARLAVTEMRARLARARARNEGAHAREEARFALEVEGDARAALRFASKNWESQREPADARVLLEAAFVAGDAGAAKPALEWLRRSRHEDVRLLALARWLRGSP
jgi:tetratricopeptide (TPR) repeat protein